VRVKANGRVVVLGTDEIDWIDGLGNYARLHSGPVVYRLRERLKNLERRLDPARFLRIHRSRIVNVGRIHELVRGAHRACSVVLVDGTPLRVSRAYRARVRQVAAGTGERT
jgi:two-component system LytT family response regulator